jgi:CBS domain-containing protein
MSDLNEQFPDKEQSDVLQSVRSLMSTAVAFIDSDAPLRAVVETMAGESLGALIVLGPEGPSRIISERDIVEALASGDADLDDTLAIDVATTGVVGADPDDTVIEAARLMAQHSVRHVPVMSAVGVVGMVSARDVLRVLANQVSPLG